MILISELSIADKANSVLNEIKMRSYFCTKEFGKLNKKKIYNIHG